MKVIIIGRDNEALEPLVEKLTLKNFQVAILANSAAVRSYIKKSTIYFLLADTKYLIKHALPQEVLTHCPLTRLIVLAANPSLIGMSEAISNGLTDYFPRQAEYFDDIVETLLKERSRLIRWRHTFLSGGGPSPKEATE
ncbi:MAG: hypothetical protein ACRCTY_04420 [Candidatus Adiutrix sp.]